MWFRKFFVGVLLVCGVSIGAYAKVSLNYPGWILLRTFQKHGTLRLTEPQSAPLQKVRMQQPAAAFPMLNLVPAHRSFYLPVYRKNTPYRLPYQSVHVRIN